MYISDPGAVLNMFLFALLVGALVYLILRWGRHRQYRAEDREKARRSGIDAHAFQTQVTMSLGHMVKGKNNLDDISSTLKQSAVEISVYQRRTLFGRAKYKTYLINRVGATPNALALFADKDSMARVK